uniref:Defective in cullin neddylation protein n=2 Tax=Macrostomum lignano TaxID=282301 RepID=A0A1I8HJ54_9PLAT
MPRVPFKSGSSRKRQLSPVAGPKAAKSCRLQLQDQEAAREAHSRELLFNQYADADGCGGIIKAAGVEALCRDLGLDPADIRLLLLAWLCSAGEMCTFTRDEFLRGCQRLRAASISRLRTGLDDKLAYMRCHSQQRDKPDCGDVNADSCSRETEFRDLYRWTFEFGLEPGQRTLPIAMAVDLWQLVFEARPTGPPAILPAWLSWLRSGGHGVRAVTRDTWRMFLAFADACAAAGGDLSAYDQSEAWPSLIDDFVEAEIRRLGQQPLEADDACGG